MEKMTDLQELLKHELKDLYSAETQLIEALPKMAENATSQDLQKAFKDHLAVTKQQRARLDKIQKLLSDGKAVKKEKNFFERLFSSDEGEEHCKAMQGLIEEAEDLMGQDMNEEVMDAALIAAAQKIEHYEISSYGTAHAYAIQLGLNEVGGLLRETLDEEYAADDSLTSLAIEKINKRADPVGINYMLNTTRGMVKKAKKAAPKKSVKKASKGTSKRKP